LVPNWEQDSESNLEHNLNQSYSQYSLSQQSSVNKRKIDGIAGIANDKTTAISTVATGTKRMEEDEGTDEMPEQHDGIMEKQETAMTDTIMTDIDQPTTSKQQQQQETTTSRNSISTTAGDFDHQFNIQPGNNNTATTSTPTGVNHQ
jgi:hypothetical protein